MNNKSETSKDAADKLVKGIRRKARKQYSAEEKIRIVLAGLRGEESITAHNLSVLGEALPDKMLNLLDLLVYLAGPSRIEKREKVGDALRDGIS